MFANSFKEAAEKRRTKVRDFLNSRHLFPEQDEDVAKNQMSKEAREALDRNRTLGVKVYETCRRAEFNAIIPCEAGATAEEAEVNVVLHHDQCRDLYLQWKKGMATM